MNSLGDIKNKRVLLLQGPMGFFFKRLDFALRKQGAKTFRIGLNAGDRFFSALDNYTPFRGKVDEWPNFIEDFLKKNSIDLVFLFGDCRYYQSIAIEKAKSLGGVKVFVFEEGYVRPHYITMEPWGVNDHSSLPRDPNFYSSLDNIKVKPPKHAGQSKFQLVLSATIYYLIANIFSFRYPNYMHHRDMSAVNEAFFGIRGAFRKIIYPFLYERGMEKMLKGRLCKRYFFVPLQTHNDFQILAHSDFKSVEKFIIFVLESFAKDAPKDIFLLFKHHPVDRGRRDYRSFIFEQAEILGVKSRIIVLYDTHLPTCIKYAKGTVTVNSTVGFTSLSYGVPTITLGRAVYDMKGLTNYGVELKEFWHNQLPPSIELFNKFRSYVISNTQLNGSFYGMFPEELKS